MRPGLGAYDLASLLYDPYVNLADAEREALLDFYLERLDSEVDQEQFRDTFLRCAIQRCSKRSVRMVLSESFEAKRSFFTTSRLPSKVFGRLPQ
jgi:hypothetical protein